ncbi:MAG: hypothetical protein QM737_22660 [Ferruginibacter sp.]
MRKQATKILKDNSWAFIAHTIAEWTHISFFDVYERSAMEVLSTYQIMLAKLEYYKSTQNQTNGKGN